MLFLPTPLQMLCIFKICYYYCIIIQLKKNSYGKTGNKLQFN
jgi:hypothetical protein